ncbi:peroxisome biogenesis factor 10 [Athalia rosae]|uniref:peroxisome biogenesis factor 10 n=1 Tax=Athalia rosae TaxID=37344 RepID=UPI002033C554|nr:peroxisome biogenesis factor 10 [Athalia rosae]
MSCLSGIILAIRWWLSASYRTGEFIVYTGISSVKMLVSAVKSLNSLSTLVYEGSVLWLQDIQECVCTVQELIRSGVQSGYEIAYVVAAVTGQAILTAFALVGGLLESIHKLILLLGSSCLFLLSLPVLFLFYSLDTLLHLFKAFGSFSQYALMRLKECGTNMHTLETLVGLVVVCGLIFAIASLTRSVAQWYYKIKNVAPRLFSAWASKTWRQMKRSATITRMRRRNNDCKLQETELCIICFEKRRSMCLLPCRHLCLCITCTQSLSDPLRCPLCRQLTEDIMQVYL